MQESIIPLPEPFALAEYGIRVVKDDAGVLCRAEFVRGVSAGGPEPHNVAASAVREWLAGNAKPLVDLEFSTLGTDFQRNVWAALRRIPAGEVWTYAQVAKELGRPNAARAVGTACGKNPLLLFTPCHRVVPAHGRAPGQVPIGRLNLGQYAAGSAVKAALLAVESGANGTLLLS